MDEKQTKQETIIGAGESIASSGHAQLISLP
jgi:hypothetical protein